MGFQTLEVRWFFPGSIPAEFNRWFTALGEFMSTDARVDHYLSGTGPMVGIKVREGFLEIKQRQQEYGHQVFNPDLSGIVESWTKWRIPIAADQLETIHQDRAWLPVHKTRQQYAFTLPGVGDIFMRHPAEIAGNGGGLELTQIRLGDTDWWTFGAEVFGEPQHLGEILQRIFSYVSDPGFSFQLDVPHSVGYPAWLEQYQRQA